VIAAMSKNAGREAVFYPKFREELLFWVKTDRKAALRILELVEAVLADPFNGIGKPEALNMNSLATGAGGYSRASLGL